jgi:hypothetical protein
LLQLRLPYLFSGLGLVVFKQVSVPSSLADPSDAGKVQLPPEFTPRSEMSLLVPSSRSLRVLVLEELGWPLRTALLKPGDLQ